MNVKIKFNKGQNVYILYTIHRKLTKADYCTKCNRADEIIKDKYRWEIDTATISGIRVNVSMEETSIGYSFKNYKFADLLERGVFKTKKQAQIECTRRNKLRLQEHVY